MAENGIQRPNRRNLLIATLFAGFAGRASAARASGVSEMLMDKLKIADLIQRERGARDAGDWAEMGACWHPSSMVDVSWYHGDGAGFVAASRRNAASGRVSVHQLSPTVVQVRQTRAIAETPCQLVSFVPVDSIEICVTGVVRLLWRAEKSAEEWLLSGLNMIYIRDHLTPCDPTNVPNIDRQELAGYRPSYRFLSYVLARSPNKPRTDLPGIDRPETVAVLRSAQANWLADA